MTDWVSVFQVNSILRHVAELLDYGSSTKLEELYEKTAWYFDEKYKKPGSSYEAFKHAVGWVAWNWQNCIWF